MTFDKPDLSWAAGLFEGEGCFSFTSSHGNRNISASVKMTDEDVIHKFKNIVGFGTIYFSPPVKSGWKPQWAWTTGSFEEVQALAAFLWPWLCSRRRGKIKTVLSKYHAHAPQSQIDRVKRTRSIVDALHEGKLKQYEIANKFGVTPATVTYIKKGWLP